MVMMWNRWNKQIRFATLLTVMLCWTAAVLAAPSAADIDALIKKGDLAGARSGIEQVIQERPNSAKAYYLYAQILHAQGQMAQARQALNKAEQLSPSMDFADPAYLARLKKDLGMAGTAGALTPQSPGAPVPQSPQSRPATNTTPQPSSGGGWSLFPLILLGLIVFGVVSFMRSRSRRRQQWYGQQPMSGNPNSPHYGQPMDRYPGSGVGPTGPMYGPTPPTAGRSGLAGAAGGFLAGLAGGALADSLLNRGHASTTPPTDATPTEPPLNLGPDEGANPAASDFDTSGLGDDWGGSDSNVASDNSSDFDTPSDFDSGDDWS